MYIFIMKVIQFRICKAIGCLLISMTAVFVMIEQFNSVITGGTRHRANMSFETGKRPINKSNGENTVDKNDPEDSLFFKIYMENEIRLAVHGSPEHFLPSYKNPCWLSGLDDPFYRDNKYKSRIERFSNKVWEALSTFVNMTSVLTNRWQNDEPWRIRCLPYAYIVGVTKSGTTDLYTQLSQHQQIATGALKEPMWWNRKRLGVEDHLNIAPYSFKNYLDLYDMAAENIRLETENHGDWENHPKITIDGSPSYLWDYDGWETIPGNVDLDEPRYILAHTLKTFVPQARIIVLLRNPIERLYSQFRMWWPSATQMEFHTQVKKALQSMNECLNTHSIRSCAYNSSINPREAKIPGRVYLRASMYDVYVSDWLEVFPRDQILIARAEDYFTNRTRVLNEILEFLELSPFRQDIIQDIIDSDVINHRWETSALAKLPILKITLELLTDFYTPHNQNLARILNDDKYLWLDE